LAPWEGSVTRYDNVVMSDGGDAAPEREKGGDNTSWANANLIEPKNEENPHGRFSWYKWTMKI
jgi:hypothetical protein